MGSVIFEARRARCGICLCSHLLKTISYFGVMDRMFDYRLSPEFGGATTDEPTIQWIQRVEMICDLCKRTDVELILLLRLRGGALVVYQQLRKREEKEFATHKTGTHSCLHSRFVQRILSVYGATTSSEGDGDWIPSKLGAT